MKQILLILFLVTAAVVIRHSMLPEPEKFEKFQPPVEINSTSYEDLFITEDPFEHYSIPKFNDYNLSLDVNNSIVNVASITPVLKTKKHKGKKSNRKVSKHATHATKPAKTKKRKKKKIPKAVYRYKGSSKLNKMSITTVESDKILKKARRYLGVKYVYGGHTFKGLDCSAFTQKIFGSFSIKLPRVACKQFLVGRIVKKSQARAGDLIFFSSKRKKIAHVGIILDPKRKLFIHASSGAKKVTISSYEKQYYKNHFKGVRRIL